MAGVVDKISEDIFPHKQLSEHVKIKKTQITEDLRGKLKVEKTTEEQELTIIKKN